MHVKFQGCNFSGILDGGYVYDELPPEPPQLLMEEPVFVAFENIEAAAK